MNESKLIAAIENAHKLLGSHATVLFHRSGQILAKSGKIEDSDYPTLAVLVAGMVAAGQSLAQLFGEASQNDYQLNHGTSDSGMYAVRIDHDHWVFSLYKNTVNPGLFRMRMRSLAQELEEYVVAEKPKYWQEPSAKKSLNATSGTNLFMDITDEEIDDLFTTNA